MNQKHIFPNQKFLTFYLPTVLLLLPLLTLSLLFHEHLFCAQQGYDSGAVATNFAIISLSFLSFINPIILLVFSYR